MSARFERLGLTFNPFEPSASGPPLGSDIWLPAKWHARITELLNLLAQGRGVKALAIDGEYGSGKTCVLQWLFAHGFPDKRIKPFYFDNPGVQFYDLANSLLRQIGRKDFAKSIWELCSGYVGPYQRSLFAEGFEEYLQPARYRRQRAGVLAELQDAIRTAGVSQDEEIAHRLALMVADTPSKPYFEYRDFVAGKGDTLVAEGEEALYFGAILKTLRLAAGINKVGFLIDEFEEVSLKKRLTTREAHDYLATLKRLINLTSGEDLWLVVAMTPSAVETTKGLEPALWDRFTSEGRYHFSVPPLEAEDAVGLVQSRLSAARIPNVQFESTLFPFPAGFENMLTPATVSNPRRLVKLCFYAVGGADDAPLPFTNGYLADVEGRAYPTPEGAQD